MKRPRDRSLPGQFEVHQGGQCGYCTGSVEEGSEGEMEAV